MGCSTLPSPRLPPVSPAYRQAVYAGSMGLLDVCRLEGLVLAVDEVFYVSHWITPDLAPKRYDTRFFLTAAPPGQVARHDDGETVASEWIRPAAALARCLAGEMELLPRPSPTCGASRASPRPPR